MSHRRIGLAQPEPQTGFGERHGFDVTFLSDAMRAASLPEYEAAIRLNLPLIANAVLTVDEFLAAIRALTAGRADAQPGDAVRGSDHEEIGTVAKVVDATAVCAPRVTHGVRDTLQMAPVKGGNSYGTCPCAARAGFTRAMP